MLQASSEGCCRNMCLPQLQARNQPGAQEFIMAGSEEYIVHVAHANRVNGHLLDFMGVEENDVAVLIPYKVEAAGWPAPHDASALRPPQDSL